MKISIFHIKTGSWLIPLLSLSFLICSIPLKGQDRCYSYEYIKEKEKHHPEIADARAKLNEEINQWISGNKFSSANRDIITIPVVVHVVYKLNEHNVSDAQIASQIDVINEDFRRMNADAVNTPALFKPIAADCGFQFCLAKQDPYGKPTTGINRVKTNADFFQMGGAVKDPNLGGALGWDGQKYLNIWVCNLSQGILGFASTPYSDPPQNDGIVISWKSFGRRGGAIFPYHLGRTVTHEIGHWLNLQHIWGDNDFSDLCSGSDFVDDTPNQASSSIGCPVFPRPSCGNTSDMFMNFMDYTRDSCMNMFTVGQKNRMLATFLTFRKDILSSEGCNEPVLKPDCDTLTNVLNPEGLYLFRSSAIAPGTKGFLAGHNQLGHRAFADYFQIGSNHKLSRLILDFARADYDDVTKDSISIKIWNSDSIPARPGKVLARKSITISSISDSIDAYRYAEVRFDPPLELKKSFFAGYEILNPLSDSVALFTTEINPSAEGTAWYQDENEEWRAYYDTLGYAARFSLALYAEMCASEGLSVPDIVSGNHKDIVCFPNPSFGKISISGLKVGEEYRWQIFSVDLRLIKTGVIPKEVSVFTLDTSDINPGLCYLFISSDKTAVVKRLTLSNQ